MKSKLENQIETTLEKISIHPLFIKSASFCLNFSSSQKLLVRKFINSTLHRLDLPTREEQEKLRYTVEELTAKIRMLEATRAPKMHENN